MPAVSPTAVAPALAERFFALTPDRVLSAVEAAGGRATGRAFAHGSLENRVYEVELEDGERRVAKFYRPGRWSRAAILEEHAFMAELVGAEVPVVAPLPLGDDGRTLGELEVEGGSILYCVYPRARGRAPEDLDEERLEWLGRLLARLHDVGARRGAPGRGVLDAESYGRASLRVLRGGDFVPDSLAGRYFDVAERVVEASAARLLADDGARIRVHGDCHPGNLLWGERGPFFLDFDDFCVGPPVQDLWLLTPGHDEDALAQRAVIVRGYRSMRPLEPGALRLVEPLRALRIVRYAAWIAGRAADPSFSRAFPDFTEASFWEREIQALSHQLPRVLESAA